MLFWPEVGDEVIVGFLNDDPRAAIVLGSLYNSPNPPIYPHDAKNPKKGLITKRLQAGI
ncbi:MAG: phage baseplate assembly protein V [Bacteroidia bacterium]